MLEFMKIIIQYFVIALFIVLSMIGLVEKDWNFGFGLNLALALLYIFLYLQPIK